MLVAEAGTMARSPTDLASSPGDGRAGAALAALVEEALRLDYLEGGVSTVAGGYSTGWRTLSMTVVAQWLKPVRLDLEGRPPHAVGARRLLLLPAGLRHRVTVVGRGRAVCRWAHVVVSALGRPDLFAGDAQPVRARALAEPIGDACARLAGLRAPDLGLAGAARRKAARAALLALLVPLAAQREAPAPVDDRLLPVLRRLQDDYATAMGRDELARAAGLSPSRFHDVFRRALGVAPLAYLRRVRMRHAQRLLATTDLPIAEVGERVGYPDPYHFSRQFRVECGASPRAHRRRAREAWFAGER